MGFSVDGKYVRVRVSRRGVGASVGPRAARVHVDPNGSTGFSSGVGPVTYSTRLSGSRAQGAESSAHPASNVKNGATSGGRPIVFLAVGAVILLAVLSSLIVSWASVTREKRNALAVGEPTVINLKGAKDVALTVDSKYWVTGSPKKDKDYENDAEPRVTSLSVKSEWRNVSVNTSEDRKVSKGGLDQYLLLIPPPRVCDELWMADELDVVQAYDGRNCAIKIGTTAPVDLGPGDRSKDKGSTEIYLGEFVDVRARQIAEDLGASPRVLANSAKDQYSKKAGCFLEGINWVEDWTRLPSSCIPEGGVAATPLEEFPAAGPVATIGQYAGLVARNKVDYQAAVNALEDGNKCNGPNRVFERDYGEEELCSRLGAVVGSTAESLSRQLQSAMGSGNTQAYIGEPPKEIEPLIAELVEASDKVKSSQVAAQRCYTNADDDCSKRFYDLRRARHGLEDKYSDWRKYGVI